MNKTIILEKFGIYERMPTTLNELQDNKIIDKIEGILARKPVQVKTEATNSCILIAGADVLRCQFLINGKRNEDIDRYITKQVRLGKGKDGIFIKFGSIVLAELKVVASVQSKRFLVEVIEN